MAFILFDIGGVTVKTDDYIAFRLLEKKGVEKKKAENFFFTEAYENFSRGKLDEKSFCRDVCKELGKELPFKVLKKAHDDHFYALDKGVLDAIKRVPRKSRGFLTDTNAWQVKRIKNFIDMKKYSDHVFESYKMGSIKRDGGIFESVKNALKKEGFQAKDMLLIDNDMFKCRSARKHGIKAYHFTDARRLKRFLARMEAAN